MMDDGWTLVFPPHPRFFDPGHFGSMFVSWLVRSRRTLKSFFGERPRMTVDLSSGIDRHYMAKLNCVSRYPGRDLFPYRSHRICNCIRLHRTAYMFAPCNHILTPHSLSTRLCCTRQSINAQQALYRRKRAPV